MTRAVAERRFTMNKKLVCIDVYTVASGDTLYTIAEKYDLPVSLLMKVNRITNPYNLQIGTKPVSYTHLDVYKRQEMTLALAEAARNTKNAAVKFPKITAVKL